MILSLPLVQIRTGCLLLCVYEKAYQRLCLQNKAQLLAHNQLAPSKSSAADCAACTLHAGGPEPGCVIADR